MSPLARTPEERASDEEILSLPDAPAAPAQARLAVRTTFNRWGLSVLIDDAELAVSELVTNAYKHGLPPVTLTINQVDGRVQIDVSDARPATSSIDWSLSRDCDESGRGLGIVEAVSDHSGTDNVVGDGKSSYASWDVDPHTPSGQ